MNGQQLSEMLVGMIVAEMKAQGITQREMAIRVDSSLGSVGRVLAKTQPAKLDTLIKYAGAVGLELRVSLHRPVSTPETKQAKFLDALVGPPRAE